MSSVLEAIQLCPLDIPKGLTLSATALTFSGKERELWLVIGGERELWLDRGGERELWLVRGGEREPGDPAARVIDPPGDRQRDQAAPGQAQEEHQEHVRVRVISHDGLDYVSLDKDLQVPWKMLKIRWKPTRNTTIQPKIYCQAQVQSQIQVPNPSPKSRFQIQVPNPRPKSKSQSKIQSPEERDWDWGWHDNPTGHHPH